MTPTIPASGLPLNSCATPAKRTRRGTVMVPKFVAVLAVSVWPAGLDVVCPRTLVSVSTATHIHTASSR